jgi:RHS repeat-associated protein
MNSFRGIAGRSFSYDDEDHLLSAGSVIYSYNLDGFLAAKTDGSDVTTYDYSSRGELLTVMLPDGRIIEYVHDPLGRRIAKKVNGVIVEKHLWQGLTHLLAIYDGSDNLLMRFEYADGRMPVAMTKGGSTYYLTYDQVGSIRVVADASGNVVKRIDFDSFGNIIDDTDPAFEVPFGFAGGMHDRDTGLVRFGYRDYDTDVGRWTAKDPIFFSGGNTDLYGYCFNDPVNITDSVGLFLDDAFSPSPNQVYGNMWMQEYGNQGPPDFENALSKVAPFVFKGAAVACGVTAGTMTENPQIGAAVFWAIDSALSGLIGGPISDPKFGVDIINPPEVHAPESILDLYR